MTINFEQDQQDAMSKTENIQSLADQVQMLEGNPQNKLVKLSKIIDKKEMSDPMLFCVEKVKEINI